MTGYAYELMTGRKNAGLYESKYVAMFRGKRVNKLGIMKMVDNLREQFGEVHPGEVVKVFRTNMDGKLEQSSTRTLI